MTFSNYTRNELARVIPPSARCCRIAELSALYDLDGFILGRKNQYLDFNNSSPLVARKIWVLLRGLYPPGLPIQVLFVKSRSRRSQTCTVRVLGKEAVGRVYRDFRDQDVLDGDGGVPRKKMLPPRLPAGGPFSAGGDLLPIPKKPITWRLPRSRPWRRRNSG